MWQTFGIFAHHRASCAEAGFWQECTEGAQICGETGPRVSTNVFVRDLVDNQLAIDTTLVSSFSETAEPSEVPLQATVLHCGRHARKVRTYPGLARDRVWVRFVAVAVEVGSWQSSDTSLFLGALARARAVRVLAASLCVFSVRFQQRSFGHVTIEEERTVSSNERKPGQIDDAEEQALRRLWWVPNT